MRTDKIIRILPSLPVVAYMLMLSVPTYAQTSEPEEEWTDEKIQLVCGMTGNVAEEIMKDRQAGVAMSEQMAKRLEDPDVPPELLRALIIVAYKQSVSFSDAVKESLVRDFRDQAELACYERFYGENGMDSK